VLNPVEAQDRHISNEDYLFCLDRTLVEKHQKKNQPFSLAVEDHSSAADSSNQDNNSSSAEDKDSFSSSNPEEVKEESNDHPEV
jgi:hypothetical protein